MRPTLLMQNPARLTTVPVAVSDRQRPKNQRLAGSEFSNVQLFYYPVFGLNDPKLLGFEGKLRWQQAVGDSSVSTQYSVRAEENELLEELEWQVLDRACWQLRQWQDGFSHADSLVLRLELLVSDALQLHQKERVDAILARYGITATQIRLELLDGAPQGTLPTPLPPFRIQHYFNDLCSASSRLSSLYQLPAGTLKINARFINERQWPILQGLFALAADLDLEAIAEGVGSNAELSRIEALAGAYLRGYICSQPLVAEEATALIAAHETELNVSH